MLHLSRPIQEVLMQRGIEDPATYLQPSAWGDLPSPHSLDGMAEAVQLIQCAIRDRRRIGVFGDYDCDGALSSAILEATLRRLGAVPVVHLPHRDDGYGLNDAAVHRFSRTSTNLLILIDNGINAVSPVRLAQRLGMTVLVVDHHQVETRAETASVWSDQMCAAGLAYMLSAALLEQTSSQEVFLQSLSRLAAIASIADCVPLVGVTRTLTRLGLHELARTRHAGILKLLSLSGVQPNQVPSAEQIAFRVAPRLNAAGRVAHPMEVLKMLTASSPEEQSEQALQLNRLNQLRRRLEGEALDELTASVDVTGRSALVIFSPQWKKGLAGVLASRARERYGLPTFVLVPDHRTGMAVGSGRSVEGLSLIEALRSCDGLLSKYGGHHQAAGVSLAPENISAFHAGLEDYRREHPLPCKGPETPAVDLDLNAARRSFYEQLRAMEPFGIGNPVPVFRIRNCSLSARSGKFATLRQGPRDLKVRLSKPLVTSIEGTAYVALNGTSATLLESVASSHGH